MNLKIDHADGLADVNMDTADLTGSRVNVAEMSLTGMQPWGMTEQIGSRTSMGVRKTYGCVYFSVT